MFKKSDYENDTLRIKDKLFPVLFFITVFLLTENDINWLGSYGNSVKIPTWPI